MRQRRLAVREAAQAGAEQHVRAVLDQGHEAELREGALAPARLGAPERGTVLPGISDVEAGPVQADEAPLTVPGTLGGARRQRVRQTLVQAAQRRLAQAGAGLRDAALARHPDRLRTPQPAQSLQKAAQHLVGACSCWMDAPQKR